jgi:hypothetical protein
MAANDDYKGVLENYRNAWLGLRMIREAVETLGPPGACVTISVRLRRMPLHPSGGDFQPRLERSARGFSLGATTGTSRWVRRLRVAA